MMTTTITIAMMKLATMSLQCLWTISTRMFPSKFEPPAIRFPNDNKPGRAATEPSYEKIPKNWQAMRANE